MNADGGEAEFLCDGMKENVGGRAMTVDGGAVRENDHVAARHATNHHVAIAGADEHAAGDEQVAGLGFADIERAAFVEAAGEHVGETFGHVLDDDEGRGKIRGKLREQILQRVGTAGGDADGDDAIRRNGRARTFFRKAEDRGNGAGGSLRPPARLATLIFSTRMSATGSRLPAAASVGLATKSMAPSARALKVEYAPSFECVLKTMTGSGAPRMIMRRVSMPSMRGISRSRVTMSGWSSSILRRAKAPSMAVPTTSMSGSRSRIIGISFRMRAESSTTRTRTRSFMRWLPGTRIERAGKDCRNVENQDDGAIAEDGGAADEIAGNDFAGEGFDDEFFFAHQAVDHQAKALFGHADDHDEVSVFLVLPGLLDRMNAIELVEADERKNLIAEAENLALVDFVNFLILNAGDFDDGGKRNGEEAAADAEEQRLDAGEGERNAKLDGGALVFAGS